MSYKTIVRVALIFFLCFSALVLFTHNVSLEVTEEDTFYLDKIVPKNISKAHELPFEKQVEIIRHIQTQIHEEIQLDYPIEYRQEREPKDLFANESGLCYDFSRTIEKALKHAGFRTRHVSIYYHYEKKPNFMLLFDKTAKSHAILEVLTTKGWMVIDSNIPWMGLDIYGNIYNLTDITAKYKLEEMPILWKDELPDDYKKYYNGNIYFLYGLYSRHGQFYPPYTPIPDYSIKELFYNFCFLK